MGSKVVDQNGLDQETWQGPAECAGPVETLEGRPGNGIGRNGEVELVGMVLSRPPDKGAAQFLSSRTPAADQRPLPKGFSIARERFEGDFG